MQCPTCRALIPDASAQCPVCFAVLRPAAPEPTVAMPAPAEPPSPPWIRNAPAPQGPVAAPPLSAPPPYPAMVAVRELGQAPRRVNRGAEVIAACVLLAGIVAACWFVRKPQGTHPLASQLRALRAGDRWSYRATIDVYDGKRKAKSGTVMVTSTIERGDLAGQPVLVEVTRSEQGGPVGRLFNRRTFFAQDPVTGDYYRLATQQSTVEDPKRIQRPTVNAPGRWAAGVVLGSQDTDDMGGTVTTTDQVIGPEIIEVPAGRFQTWKVQSSTNSNSLLGGSGDETAWWAPQLGQPVKDVAKVSIGGIADATITLELASTTVALDPPAPEGVKPAPKP